MIYHGPEIDLEDMEKWSRSHAAAVEKLRFDERLKTAVITTHYHSKFQGKVKHWTKLGKAVAFRGRSRARLTRPLVRVLA